MQALTLLFALLVAAGTAEPSDASEKFVVVNHGHFAPHEVGRVREQLETGVRVLTNYVGPLPARKFPATVNLHPGRGNSHSHNGQGPIELYWVRELRAPIIHELTHVLGGYTAANGHWTQEGFASYMQDQYGEDRAFPTWKMDHALMSIIIKEKVILAMPDVMRDRNRARYFGITTRWERWLAYTQSTSFCRYLIETHGRHKFLKIYDLPLSAVDFSGIYGKSADVLINDWLQYVTDLGLNTAEAQATFRNMKISLRAKER